MSDANNLRAELYIGAFGPTIRIELRSITDVYHLKSVLGDLAECKTQVLALEKSGFRLEGFESLKLEVRAEVESYNQKHLHAVSVGKKYVWDHSAEGWQWCAELVNALATPGTHQYLSDEGVDDALVEVVFTSEGPSVCSPS